MQQSIVSIIEMAGTESASKGSPDGNDNHDLNSAKHSTSRMQGFKDNLNLFRSPSPARSMNENSQEQASRLKPPGGDDVVTTSNASSQDSDSLRRKKNQKKRLVEDNREFRDWKEREQYIRRQYKRDDVPHARTPGSVAFETESDEIMNNSSSRRMSGAYTGKRKCSFFFKVSHQLLTKMVNRSQVSTR